MSKKKVKNFFAYKKDIVSLKKSISELNKKKKALQKELSNLNNMYQLPKELKNQLPACSNIYEKAPVQDGPTDFTTLRDKIRIEHGEKVEELEGIIAKIKAYEVDMILAKISYFEKEVKNG